MSSARRVRVNDNVVAAGKYSVWMSPGREEWTVHLHRAPQLFHTQPPKLPDMLVSFKVKPRETPTVEVLTFGFPEVRRDGATLAACHTSSTSR